MLVQIFVTNIRLHNFSYVHFCIYILGKGERLNCKHITSFMLIYKIHLHKHFLWTFLLKAEATSLHTQVLHKHLKQPLTFEYEIGLYHQRNRLMTVQHIKCIQRRLQEAITAWGHFNVKISIKFISKGFGLWQQWKLNHYHNGPLIMYTIIKFSRVNWKY